MLDVRCPLVPAFLLSSATTIRGQMAFRQSFIGDSAKLVIQRTSHSQPRFLHDVRIYHRRRNIFVPEPSALAHLASRREDTRLGRAENFLPVKM